MTRRDVLGRVRQTVTKEEACMEQVVVEKVLSAVRTRLSDPLTLDDLASMARFSKFHFARMFRRVTGLSPRRFLYALRLQEAKRLLVTTSRSVAQISNDVGYHSVGTFTSRFAASVGAPPAVYRQFRGDFEALASQNPRSTDTSGAVVRGTVRAEPDQPLAAPISVGMFRRPIAEGMPERSVVLPGGGSWEIREVPEGRWYLVAVSYAASQDLARADRAGGEFLVGVAGPVTVKAASAGVGPADGETVAELWLRPARPVDPPVLSALATWPGAAGAGVHTAVLPRLAGASGRDLAARERASTWV